MKKELHLKANDGRTYVLPVKYDKEIEIEYVELPEDWTEEMKDAYMKFVYPNGYITMYWNKAKI